MREYYSEEEIKFADQVGKLAQEFALSLAPAIVEEKIDVGIDFRPLEHAYEMWVNILKGYFE